MIAVLIGLGPNSVEIPCMLFESAEKAHTFAKVNFGEQNKHGQYKVDFDEERVYDESEYDAKTVEEMKADGCVFGIPKWKSIFKNYYGGCGECFALIVKEVPFESVFVSWDLD